MKHSARTLGALFFGGLLGLSLLFAQTAHAQAPSFLFGRDPQEAFGRAANESSVRFHQDLRKFETAGYRELLTHWGADSPRQIVFVVKDDELASIYTKTFLAHVALEKGNLMKLYSLSNRDYNRLAAMTFGILGRESKFGTSRRYYVKEALPDFAIFTLKANVAVGRAVKDALWDLVTLSKPEWHVRISPSSNGPTQIKQIPWRIRQNYCVYEDGLQDPRSAAVATMGFLAEALRETRQRVKNRELKMIDENNVFDYVLYVYTGRIRQILKEPDQVAFGSYIRTVKHYMQSLTLLERDTPLRLQKVDPKCMISELPH